MADIWAKSKRSEVMSLIRSHGNKATELRLIEVFKLHRITGWRRRQALFGKPDFVFRRERVAVFVDGCYWHRHPGCSSASNPKSRREFWLPKFASNVARDKLVMRTLKRSGWRVVRIWECQLTTRHSSRAAMRVRRALDSGR